MKQREEHQRTTGKKVWLVTGAGRGMGVDIAKAALAAGHAVVATGRDTKAVEKAVGKSNDLIWSSNWTSPALPTQRPLRGLSSAGGRGSDAPLRFGILGLGLITNTGILIP